MTIQELKAYAYDLLAQIQKCQMELQKVNEQIAKLASQPAKTDDTQAA